MSQEDESMKEKERLRIAEAAKAAAQLAAINIQRYLELHRAEAGPSVMAIHEEQFASEAEKAAELASESIKRFLESRKSK